MDVKVGNEYGYDFEEPRNKSKKIRIKVLKIEPRGILFEILHTKQRQKQFWVGRLRFMDKVIK